MRAILFVVMLLAAAVSWLWLSGRIPDRPSVQTIRDDRHSTTAETAVDVISIWTSCGMPDLSENWDDKKLSGVAQALRQLQTHHPRHLPDSRSDAGRAFFRKLGLAVQRFHLLSSANKITTYNAFKELLPAYASRSQTGRRYDLEMALLVGLQFELMSGITEDQAFLKDFSERTTRTARSLDGGYWVMQGETISFLGGSQKLQTDITGLLDGISDHRAFGIEARKLALSHISLHLPNIARRTRMNNLSLKVRALRDKEPDSEVRGYYNTLLGRL